MNRWLDDFTRGFGFPAIGRTSWSSSWPHVEVSEMDTVVKVAAELPGAEEKNLGLSLHDGVLTITGEKTSRTEGALYSEHWQGQFQRSIQVGPNVDPDKLTATFKNGVLSVALAKRPDTAAAVKRIPLAAG